MPQYEKEPNYIKNRHLLVIPNNTDTVDDKIKIHEERAYSLIEWRKNQYSRIQEDTTILYIGGQDTNDASETCFYEGGKDINPNKFGNTVVERWPISEELYKIVGCDSEFRIYKDIGHTTTDEIEEHIIDLLIKNSN